MSNYRVQQVLALGPLPERQLRLLIALATFMNDHTLAVSAGFDAIVTVSGRSSNTIRAARRDAKNAGRLNWTAGKGRGNNTTWLVCCLPLKGTNVLGTYSEPGKGTNHEPEKVPTEGEKRYQPKSADLQEPERCLKSLSKESVSLAARVRELLTAVDPDVSERETDSIITKIRSNGGRNVLAIVRKNIANGDAVFDIADARKLLEYPSLPVTPDLLTNGQRPRCEPSSKGILTDACRHGDSRLCLFSWCECPCHPRNQQ